MAVISLTKGSKPKVQKVTDSLLYHAWHGHLQNVLFPSGNAKNSDHRLFKMLLLNLIVRWPMGPATILQAISMTFGLWKIQIMNNRMVSFEWKTSKHNLSWGKGGTCCIFVILLWEFQSIIFFSIFLKYCEDHIMKKLRWLNLKWNCCFQVSSYTLCVFRNHQSHNGRAHGSRYC